MRKTLIPVLLAIGFLLPATSLAQENTEPIVLEASVIVAQPPLVKTVGDTVVFNPGALNVEEDATLEDLLRKIPGLEVEGGTVTLYGRKVEKLLVGGRLYFGGDVLTGLKNIQGDEVDEIRSYERPSDFARLSGVDDGEAEPVLDIRIKKKFIGTWKGRLQGGGSYPLRYTASVNGGFLTDTMQLSALTNLRNRPAPPTIPTTSLTKFGNGAEGLQDHREAGVDYSINGKKREISANVKYTGSTYDRLRDGWSRSLYAKGSSYSLSNINQRGHNEKFQAQGEWELKPDKSNTFYIKPVFIWTGSGAWSAPLTGSLTFNSDPRTDGEAIPVNTVTQRTATLQDKFDGQFTFQYTHRFPKKGRTGSIRVSEMVSGGWTHTFNDYNALAYKTEKTTVRKQYVRSPWVRNDLYAQGSWNEPFGKGFYLQLIFQTRIVWHGINRDFHTMSELGGIDAWTVAPLMRLSEQLATLPDGWASALDPELSSEGTYTGVLLTASANLRYSRKKFNTTFGVALKPVWSIVRYSTTGLQDQVTRSFSFYAAPNFSLRYNKSKTEYVSAFYRTNVSTPSPTSLIPIRSGTNPLYVRIGNPDLKHSFTHRLNLTYNYSNPQKGSSIVLEAEGRYVQNAFATSTEYIPETGGRQIRSCNIDGNGSARASLTVNHTFRGTPLSLVNHFNGAFVNDAAYMYNTSTREDEVSVMQRFSVRERLELTARWRKFSLTVQGGGEFAYERSLLRPELKQSPYALYTGAEFSWSLPHRWRIASDFGFYATRGHGFEELDRNLYMLNASISKGLGKGMTLRLTGGDLLNQNTHITYRFGTSNQQLFIYNGLGRSILLQFICRFPNTER